MRTALFAILLVTLPALAQLQAAPTASLADSSWVGAKAGRPKGNSPAQLRLQQQSGVLTAVLTCDDVEETLTVTISSPTTLQFKGISFKDLKYSGRNRPLDFSLDTFTGELSQQGQQLSLTGADGRGSHSRYEFRLSRSR